MLGFRLPFYSSPTLLLSLGLSLRVLWYLMTLRPNLIHVSSPGVMVFAATLYSKVCCCCCRALYCRVRWLCCRAHVHMRWVCCCCRSLYCRAHAHVWRLYC